MKRLKKKPYVLKKDEAVCRSDPIGYELGKQDEEAHFKALDEAAGTSEGATASRPSSSEDSG